MLKKRDLHNLKSNFLIKDSQFYIANFLGLSDKFKNISIIKESTLSYIFLPKKLFCIIYEKPFQGSNFLISYLAENEHIKECVATLVTESHILGDIKDIN